MNKQKIYNYISLGTIGVLAFLLFSNGCTPRLSTETPAEIIKEVDPLIIRDTILTYRTDTIRQKEIIYLGKDTPEAPDTIYREGPAADTVTVYSGFVEDSAAVVKYQARTRGELLDIGLWYRLKEPKIIERIITERVNVPAYKAGFYLGSGLEYHPGGLVGLELSAGLVTAQKLYLGYSYGLGFKSHHITIQRRLF